MNSDQWLKLSCKAFVLGGILDTLPSDFPGIRELRIQNSKLQRMLTKPGDKGGTPNWMRILGGGSLKKAAKWQGKLAAKVGRQARKVHSMAETGFKEWFRRDRAYSNVEFQQWLAKFDAAIESEAATLQKRIMGNVNKYATPTSGFGRLKGRLTNR